MNRVSATIAIALAFAAVPGASIAKDAPKAGIGVATSTERSQMKVAEVMAGGTGELMGLRVGDVITHAGGKRMNYDWKMSAYMRSLKPGDTVELTVKRGGESLQLKGRAMARTW